MQSNQQSFYDEFSLYQNEFVITEKLLDEKLSSTGKLSCIELKVSQITLDTQIIRKTMQALVEGRATNGLIKDERKQLDLRLNPDTSLSVLKVDLPLVTVINKEQTHYSLVGKYWQIDLIKLIAKGNPNQMLNCLLLPKSTPAALANIYADSQFAAHYALTNMLSQQWNAGVLHDCFTQRPSDAHSAQFLRVTTKVFQDMRAAQNRSKAKPHE